MCATATRAATDVEPRERIQRRGQVQERGEPLVLVDQRSVHDTRPVGESLGLGPIPIGHLAIAREGCEHHCRQGLLERTQRELGVRIPLGDDLSLLGEAHPPAYRAARLREDRTVGPRASPRRRAAAAVKEPQLDSTRIRIGQQPLLRRVQLPLARQKTAVLRGVGVTEHDLLAP